MTRLPMAFAVRALVTLATCALTAAACSSSSTPTLGAAPAAPLRLRIHHEPGGRIFINPTPVECTLQDGPFDGSPNGPEVDECDIPASEAVEQEYLLAAHPRYAFIPGGWKITGCGAPPVVIDADPFRFRPLDFAPDGGRCLVDVDLMFAPRSPADSGTADGDDGGR